jgi:drug/metabolite transporter (DMT)-like permease
MIKGIVRGFLAYSLFSWGDGSVKALAGGPSVFEIGFFVTLFALMVVVAFGRPRGERWRDLFRMNHPRLVMTRTAAGITAGLCGIIAFTTIPFAEAYALIFLSPAIVTILSVGLLGEQIRWRRWLAVAVGFAGVLIIVRPGFRELLPGHFAALTVSLCAATTVLVLRRIGRTEKRTSLIGVVLLSALVFNGILMLPGFQWPTSEQLIFLASAGCLAAGGHLSLLAATRLAPASQVAPTQYCQMVWAVVVGWIVYKEMPDGFTIAGLALIAFSGLFTILREEQVAGWWQRIILLRNRP